MSPRQFVMSARAVVFDGQGRCLVVRRATSSRHFPGCWEWPGGKVDPGEDLGDALRREVLEETGLGVEPLGLAVAVEVTVGDKVVIQVCLESAWVGGVLRLSPEHDAAAWLKPCELGEIHLVPAMRAAMIECRPKERGSE
ncbi:MAG: NUDIX hydrolase [Verrucomicrobiota bacterium]